MPEDMLRPTVTGIEIDPLTARIAKVLYPDTDIRPQPFEQTKLADGFYDLAISGMPFGDLHRSRSPFQYSKLQIHDYFFAAALEKVRPDGLLMFITSPGTMDKLDSTRCASCCPRARVTPARFVCPMTPSRKTPARKSRPTS